MGRPERQGAPPPPPSGGRPVERPGPPPGRLRRLGPLARRARTDPLGSAELPVLRLPDLPHRDLRARARTGGGRDLTGAGARDLAATAPHLAAPGADRRCQVPAPAVA